MLGCQSASESHWSCPDKILIASTTCLVISAVAFAIIFFTMSPLTNSSGMIGLLADTTVGGLALLTLLAAGLWKMCHKEEPTSLRMREALSTDWEAIATSKPTEKIASYQYSRIFEHTDFPDFIFEVTSIKRAKQHLESFNFCKQVITDHNLTCCFIPEAEVISVENDPTKAFFVIRKVKGHTYDSQEVSEQAFERFKEDPALEKKWREFFRQAAEFICFTEFPFATWKNITLMENGFCFEGFDVLVPQNKPSLGGLIRLLTIAPPQFYKMIKEIAQKHGVELNQPEPSYDWKGFFAEIPKREHQLQLRSEVRKWHREKGITGAEKISLDEWPEEGSFERVIITRFNENVAKMKENPNHASSSVDLRTLTWIPFLKSTAHESRFKDALTHLKEKGILYTWRKTQAESNDSPYLLQF